MPYRKELDERIRKIISGRKNISDRKMFGGVCHLLKDNMFCGVYRDFLILRLGKKGAEEALKGKFVKPFDITGRPMKGWVMITPEGVENDEPLEAWLNEALDFARILPPKKGGRK